MYMWMSWYSVGNAMENQIKAYKYVHSVCPLYEFAMCATQTSIDRMTKPDTAICYATYTSTYIFISLHVFGYLFVLCVRVHIYWINVESGNESVVES